MLPKSRQSAATRCPRRGHRLPIRCRAAARTLPKGCRKLPKAALDLGATDALNILRWKDKRSLRRVSPEKHAFPGAFDPSRDGWSPRLEPMAEPIRRTSVPPHDAAPA
jgi:hypothetical protein